MNSDGSSQSPSPSGGTLMAGPAGQGSYVVKSGESIESIAFDTGFYHQTIWNDPRNEALRNARANRNELLPGDRVAIPEKEPKIETIATGREHTFRRRGVPAVFRVQLLNDGIPRAGEAYSLVIDGVTYQGVTDGEGRIEHHVPPNASQGKLEAGETVYSFRIGVLDPITEVSGVQKRLANLGFECEPSGDLDRRTRAALCAFQRSQELEVTGAIDDATVQALKRVHTAG